MRKIITTILIISIVLSNFSTISLANVQIQVGSVTIDDVHYVVGENIVTGEPMISPTITMSWGDPSSWADAPDIADIHTPDYYVVTIDNKTLGTTNDIRVDKGTPEFNNKSLDLHEEINLPTGSLYEVIVTPYHYHDTGGGNLVLAPSSGTPKRAYAVTDLQVELDSNEDSIQIVWDDLGYPDIDYRIVYAVGDYTNRTKQELLNNKEGEIVTNSDSDDVEQFFDQISRRNKLSYTLSDNIYPGQVYSIMVEPLADYYEGKLVVRNRNYPYIKSTSTNINLTGTEEGDYLRLQWEIPASFKVGQNKDEYGLVEANIIEYREGQGRNIAIFNGDAAVIGYYKVPKPIWETEYQLVLTYKAVDDASKPPIQPVSNRLSYVPSELQIQPTKPVVPKPISQKIINDLKDPASTDNVNNYLVPSHSYNGDLDDLLDQNTTFHYNDDSDTINFVWGAFRRLDIDQTSSTYNEWITDTNIYYDIWVTDTLNSLSSATRVVDDVRFGSISTDNIITNNSGTILGYKYNLEQYYNEEEGELKQIVPNKIYYVKIVAKKRTSSGDIISVPTIASIYYTDNGDVFAPPILAKPPLSVKSNETTETGVTLEWKENWSEVISPDVVAPHPLAEWKHELWVEDDGTISDTEVDNAEHFKIYLGDEEIIRFKNYLTSLGVGITIQDRTVNMGVDDIGASNVRYKFYRIPYDNVQDALTPVYTFEDYYEDLINNDKNGTAPILWNDITPNRNTVDNNILYYREEGLLPNTSYLFIVYPYRILNTGEELIAHYPTPIVVSTQPEDVAINPDPIVPNLYVSNQTDTSITVTWKYDTNFSYELKYSLGEDVESAKGVEWELPSSTLDPDYPVDGEYYEVVIDDLFPNTSYNVWIQATQEANGNTSAWSNPALGTTRNIANPNPPKGVGIASNASMNKHNLENNVTEDYITIEWIKDVEDVSNTEEGNVQKLYSYIIEIADNPKFVDPQYIESSGGENDIVPDNVEILEKNLLKVNNLIANRNYYIRIKTRVTVTGSEQGQLIVKNSLTFSEPIKVTTLSSGHEFDGNKDPALEILPSDDYEIIYDGNKKELNYRFRDDSVGEDGSADNNVDQRFISNLVSRNIYEYNIDVSNYEDKPITKRKVTIPYTIIEALDEYKVGLNIDAGDINIKLPYDWVAREVSRQVKQYGIAPSVLIKIEQSDAYYSEEQLPLQAIKSIAIPQEISVYVSSEKGTNSINYLDKNMTISLKTNNRYDLYGKEAVTYAYTKDAKKDWATVNSKYDKYKGSMTFNTSKLGTYGIYLSEGSSSNVVNKAHWSESYRKDILSKYTINGLDNYNANNKVKEAEIINIIYDIVVKDKVIDINEYVSKEKTKVMSTSGIKQNESKNQSTITREETISMFVRAYEIKNDTTVKPDSNAMKRINSNNNISSKYKNDIGKAVSLGLVSDVNNVRAKDAIKYGELFCIWSIMEKQ